MMVGRTATTDPALVEGFLGASRTLVGIAVRSVERAGSPLTVPQHRVLVLLDVDGALTVGELARHVGVNQSNASRMVDRLQRLGLVSRERAAEDGRVVRVAITGSGRELVGRVTDARRAEIVEILDAMPPDDVSRLVSALDAFDRSAHGRSVH